MDIIADIKSVPIKDIEIDDNIRIRNDTCSIEYLLKSISSVGLLHPVIVKSKGNKYILISGKRRLDAMKALGHSFIEVKIVDPTPEEEIYIQIYENQARDSYSSEEGFYASNKYNLPVDDKTENPRHMVSNHEEWPMEGDF